MTFRMVALLALAGTAVPAAPSTTRYRVDQTVDQAVDASVIGAGNSDSGSPWRPLSR